MYSALRRGRDVDSPIDASDENGRIGAPNGTHKLAKVAVSPEGQLGGGRPPGGNVLPLAQEVVSAEAAKDGEDEDLEDDAGDDGAVARLREGGPAAAGGGRDAAPDGLDDEARQVGGQKDARVPRRRQARQGRVEVQRDVLEGEVDGDADEGWGEDDGADLELEGALVPRVLVQQDPADVACTMMSIPPFLILLYA